MMECAACGKTIPRDSKFCIHCGSPQSLLEHDSVSSTKEEGGEYKISNHQSVLRDQPHNSGKTTQNEKLPGDQQSNKDNHSRLWAFAIPLGVVLSILIRISVVSTTGYFNINDVICGSVFNAVFYSIVIYGILRLFSYLK